MRKIGKILLWVLGIILILGVIGSMLGEDTENQQAEPASSIQTEEVETETDSESATEQEEEATEEDREEGNNEVYGIGDYVEVGKLAYTVHSVETTNILESDNQFIDPATTDGQFVIVEIEAFNNDSETRMVDSSMFKLIDDQGREFNTSTDTDVMMVLDESLNLFLQDINPGISKTGKLVFELPNDVTSYELQVSSGFGFAGGEYATIKLN